LKVSLVDHGAAIFQPVPSSTNHLYSRPLPPPVAAAVQAIVVPGGCGGEGFDANVTVLTGWTGAEVACGTTPGELANKSVLGTSSIANAASIVASKSSIELSAPRTQTARRYRGLANTGVHLSVLDSDQFLTTSHSEPLKSNHLYWYGALPPRGVAVQVIVVPGRCGTDRSASRITALARVRKTGGAKLDDVLMGIRGRFSKAQARELDSRKKIDAECS